MDVTNMTITELRAVMDDCRREYARRVRVAVGSGSLPVPKLIFGDDGKLRLYKSIQAYHKDHPHIDMLTCTEAVKAEASL